MTVGINRIKEILNLPACCGSLKGDDGSYCALGKANLVGSNALDLPVSRLDAICQTE